MTTIVPVILCGGSGTRLWPLSTPDQPKQFHALLGDSSMFRQTVDRTADRTCFAAPIIVCGTRHAGLVEAELVAAGVADATIIIEPAARNTAPAIALAALHLPPDAALLVMPSDHVMTDPAELLAAVKCAMPAVAAGAIATFGIAPHYPETGYGYIRAGAPLGDAGGPCRIAAFVEKPDAQRAAAMLAAGGHYWNAGIFLMRSDAYLAEMQRQQAAMYQACAAAMATTGKDGLHVHPDAASFAACPAQSIDYAIMEAAQQAVVMPVNPGWSDVGSWAALHAIAPRDATGNAVTGDVTVIDGHDLLIRANGDLRIATLGVSNLVIVAHGRDILVIPRDRAQEVKAIVDRMNGD